MARFEYTKMICFSQELCYDDFDKIPISMFFYVHYGTTQYKHSDVDVLFVKQLRSCCGNIVLYDFIFQNNNKIKK